MCGNGSAIFLLINSMLGNKSCNLQCVVVFHWVYLIFQNSESSELCKYSYDDCTQVNNYSLYTEHVTLK